MSVRGAVKKHKKIADKHLKAGRLTDAQQALFEICKLQPEDEKAWREFAALAASLGRFHDARAALQRALSINPNRAETYYDLAQIQMTLADHVEADRNYRAFLQWHPESGKGHHALARLLRQCGHPGEAEAHFRKALSHADNNAEARLELSEILQQRGLYEESLSLLSKAHELQPNSARICNALGAFHRDTLDRDKALHWFRKALELAPGEKAVYLYYVASTHEIAGDKEEALRHYEQALELDADLLDARLRRAACLLSLGRLKEGFAEYENRLRHPAWRQCNYVNHSIPLWRGQPLDGKRILVIAEQGHGDNIQFSRYLPMLAERCASVVVHCKPELAPLLEHLAGVITDDKKISPQDYDVCVYMMSLTHRFDTDLETIPQQSPYLRAPADKVHQWQGTLDAKQLKVGLVWAGNPSHQRNAFRSISLNELAPLANVPDIQFISLQKGIAAEEAEHPPAGMNLLNPAPELHDFADTAALISCLDLVISVDTATTHLAGALGKPVWTLVYFPAEWRWLETRPDSPWYPSMRLYRQRRTGQWGDVVQQVAKDLTTIASS